MRREGRENTVFENQELSPIPNPRSNPTWVKEKKSSEYQNSYWLKINADRGKRKHSFRESRVIADSEPRFESNLAKEKRALGVRTLLG